MSAAVAQRAPLGRTSSPMDTKKTILKSEESSANSKDQNPAPNAEASQSLPPPPRPAASGAGETPDYFSSLHNPFSLEPNPFEQSFGNPSTETPGKSLLPPVASITSPALPGPSSTGYNWSNSLRSGPLSPAMLAGPTGGDYFDSIGRGFPTPNESSLRTGLTPGGGGSMFPAPSPNSQAILSQLQSGGATPSTLEFHRTALNAAKRSGFNVPTSNPTSEPEQLQNMDKKTITAAVDPFTHHDAADAANGLFMLAKGGQANNESFPASINKPSDLASDNKRATRNANNNSVSSGRELTAEGSDSQGEQTKPATKGKGKKNTPAKLAAPVNGRRKAEETPKGSNKRTKTSNGPVEATPEEESDDEDMKDEFGGRDPKKMTDEEKRKNFLERNRVAALKCRQRKKQWLANLQAKVELFTTENDALTATVTQLREEIVNLKTLLLAHKDCPVSQAQGLGPLIMSGMTTGFEPHPYAIPNTIGIPPGAPIPAQAMRR